MPRRSIRWLLAIVTAAFCLAAVTVSAGVAHGSIMPMANDRFNDTSPHFGGAFITSTLGTCTAGFSVFDQNGFPGSVTAGHCGPDGTNYSAPSTGFYGQIRGQILNGIADMARLESVFQPVTYAPIIHTGPSAPTTRTVKGKADPDADDLVCVSGAITEAKCDLRVLPGKHSLCYFTPVGPACTHGLTIAERLNATVVTRGDSGGPVYTRSGATGAIINGMIIGQSGDHHVYFHTVSEIESRLGVRVMTG